MTIGIDARLWSQGGVGRYIKNLVLNLQRIDKNNKYVLFALRENLLELQDKIVNTNWTILEADVRWHTLSEQTIFLQIVNRENLNLMHFPYVSVPIFYKRPYVVTVHDLIPYYYSTGNASTLPLPLYAAKRIGYKLVLSNAIKRSAKIIVPLDSVKNDLVSAFKVNKNKVVVTNEAIDDSIATREDKDENSYGKYFLYVGNAYPHKNLGRLIKAFLNLNKNNVKLVLVGKKDHFYEQLEKSVSSQKVIFTGKISDMELSNLYKNALALVQPSFMEGFGLPVLEAMNNRCLVISSDIPAAREVAGNNAIYFNPKSVTELTKIFNNVLKTPNDNQALKENAYKRSLEFSWEKMAKQTVEVYESSISLR